MYFPIFARSTMLSVLEYFQVIGFSCPVFSWNILESIGVSSHTLAYVYVVVVVWLPPSLSDDVASDFSSHWYISTVLMRRIPENVSPNCVSESASSVSIFPVRCTSLPSRVGSTASACASCTLDCHSRIALCISALRHSLFQRVKHAKNTRTGPMMIPASASLILEPYDWVVVTVTWSFDIGIVVKKDVNSQKYIHHEGKSRNKNWVCNDKRFI